MILKFIILFCFILILYYLIIIKNFILIIFPIKPFINPQYWLCNQKLENIEEINKFLNSQNMKTKINIIVKSSYILYSQDLDKKCKAYFEILYMNLLEKINNEKKIKLYPVHKDYFERYYVIYYSKNNRCLPHYDGCPKNIIKVTIVLENLEDNPVFWVENKKREKIYFSENIGDIFCFRASQTKHGVKKINNKRTVLILSYSDKPNLPKFSCVCSRLYS